MLGQSSATDLMQRLVVCGRTGVLAVVRRCCAVPGTGGGGGGASRKSLWGVPGSVLGGRRLAASVLMNWGHPEIWSTTRPDLAIVIIH